MIKFVDALSLDTVVITGGAELTGHSPNSLHYNNLAIDVAGPKFNNLTHGQVLGAAKAAGYAHGQFENFSGQNRDHWHLQLQSGNGVPALGNSMTTKNY